MILNRRNLLDVVISQYKHQSSSVRAHCRKGDARCITQHLKAGKGMALPTQILLKKLTRLAEQEDKTDALLAELKVPHIQVTYERLYQAGNDTSEWTKIFKFLGVGPADGLSREQLEGAMKFAPTSKPSHRTTLANFDEVSSVLKGTKFEGLLH